MGGEGSGRKPDPIKPLLQPKVPIGQTAQEGLFLPNYSGLKEAARKTKAFTSGSIIFSNGTDFSEDNSNLYWDSSGKLGIGTTTPNNKLEVASLFSIDDTNFNLLIGKDAGKNLNGATKCVAIGEEALRDSVTGSSNVCIGYRAGVLLESGTNTFVGTEAGYSSTTAIYNNALGYYALRTNTTGDFNNCMGALSLFRNTTGSRNNAMGYYALYENTTGIGNVGVGYESGRDNKIGSYNTSIGYTSGLLNISGSYNTYIGYNAGGNMTSGSYNIIIGASLSAQNPVGNYQLVIGNLIFGTNIDGTGTLMSSGNIGIGVPTPSARLDVSGSIIRLRSSNTPASGSATGNAGDICWDADYIYVCTAANTWKRAAIATW